MASYFQLCGDVFKAPYSGEESTESVYCGQHKTIANPVALVAADTIEIPMFEVPAGVRIHAIRWALGGTLGAASTATVVIRKKTNTVNPNTNIGGTNGGAASGVSASTFDRTLQVNAANVAITSTAAGNGIFTVIPTTFEGLVPPKQVTAEPYYVSLLVTIGAGAAFTVGADVFLAVAGEFVGLA